MEISLRRSFQIQARVVGALLLREVITRFGRHSIGVLWLIVEPVLFTLGVTVLWYFIRAHTVTNIPVVAFAITGYSTILLWRNVANRCMHAIEPNLSLMYHRNVRVIDIFLARSLLEIIGATSSFVILSCAAAALELIRWPVDPLQLLVGWLLYCWFALALGFIVGSISERSEFFGRIWHVATYLFFPFSGAAFMVNWLPLSLREQALWIPMVHGCELVREGFFGDVIRTHGSVSFLLAVNMGMTLIGVALVREAGRRVQPE